MSTARTIIAAFGGRRPVAEITGATPDAVTQWNRIGIPPKHHRKLVEAAAERQIGVVTYEALEASRTPQQAA